MTALKEVKMGPDTRKEIEAVKAVAHSAMNKINTHEVLCAERYDNLLSTLSRLDKTVAEVVSSTNSMVWKFIVGVIAVGTLLTSYSIFLLKLGNKL